MEVKDNGSVIALSHFQASRYCILYETSPQKKWLAARS